MAGHSTNITPDRSRIIMQVSQSLNPPTGRPGKLMSAVEPVEAAPLTIRHILSSFGLCTVRMVRW
jgi:hypothetical protein